ncbi:MAG: hypothetical protein WC774_01340 [Candidatus Gracilibacteria bacterium]
MIIAFPYGHTDVQEIVTAVVQESGIDSLKEKVITQVKNAMGITNGNIPQRVNTWIYNICLVHTGEKPLRPFTGKLAEPLDLASLPNSTFCGRKANI